MGLKFHFIGTFSAYSTDLIDTVREKEGCRFTNLSSKPVQTCYNTLQFQSESVFSRAFFLYSVRVHQCEVEKSDLHPSKLNALFFFL